MLRIKSKVSTSFGPPPQARGLFELSEIQKATKNFDESLVIGRGGFGNVYKGKFSNGDVAAIKRLNPESNQGATEFRAEVEMLFTLRHCNLVSMIGYCNHERDVKSFSVLRPWDPTLSHEKEMILLYEYMCNGTLKELLHEHGHHVSFADRLGICIGVGRGLDYLHTGTETGTIHRDIKSSNILFNENGTAKISDFGLSKIGPSNGSPSICTIPKGTIGYIDPDYYTCGRVTRKSDVYSFGVVMLELLCRKPALDTSRDDNQRSLVTWVQEFINKGEKMDIVDSDIREETSLEILNDFFRIVERCLHKCPDERPNMSEVVASLEMLQNSFNSSLRPADIFVKGNSMSSSPGGKKFMFNDLKKATEGFSKDLSIGEGSDGKTFLGWVDRNTLAPSNHVYGIAVAVQRVTSEIPGVDIELPDDVNFLGQLAHPNIIRLLGCYIRNDDDDGHEHLLVYEYMKKSLSHFIHGDEPLPWITRINIMIGVAHAMIYLFRIKGLLCHFKCNGILLDEDFNAKLGCFGWAKHNSEKVETDDRVWLNGVFGYLRADYDISTGHVMMKNDVFSFGLVLLETITGRPSTNIDLRDLLKRLERLKAKARATDIKSKGKLLKNIMDPRLEGSYHIEDAFKCVTLVLKCVAKQHADKPSREEILRSLEEIVASKQ